MARKAAGIFGLVAGILANVRHTFLRRKNLWEKNSNTAGI